MPAEQVGRGAFVALETVAQAVIISDYKSRPRELMPREDGFVVIRVIDFAVRARD